MERPPVAALRRRRSNWFMFLLKGLSAFLLIFVVAIAGSVAVLAENPSALQAVTARFLPPQANTQQWDGRSRVVIALYGLTQRTTEPARTDTLLILTLDPQKHSASLLSVPRDLWVNIPGYGFGKLAIAYELGGPKLATYVLQRDMGIPVNYYVALTFKSFTHFVDALGGVNMTIKSELNDPTYPCLTTTAFCPIDLKPGTQHLDGATALEFVRERHAFADQDLQRVKDQQAFVAALRKQAMAMATVQRLPKLMALIKHELITNVPFNDLPSVVLEYTRIPQSQIVHKYIDLQSALVRPAWSNDGQSILEPATTGGLAALIAHMTHDASSARPGAGITVWNGTRTLGLATDISGALVSDGFTVALTGNTPHSGRTHTVIVRNTLVSGSVDDITMKLSEMLNAPVLHRPEMGAKTPIVILVGSDVPTVH